MGIKNKTEITYTPNRFDYIEELDRRWKADKERVKNSIGQMTDDEIIDRLNKE